MSCGVVGRTGSGKSSLLLTLLRLIDMDGGRILVDGLDIGALGLDALRQQLSSPRWGVAHVQTLHYRPDVRCQVVASFLQPK